MKIFMSDVLKFQELYNKLKDKQIPLKTAYKLNKIFLLVDKEAQFYQSKFAEIVNKYAERDENGQYVMNDPSSVKIQADKLDDCQKELNELVALDIECPATPIKLEELESLEIGLGEMSALMPFIEE